MINSISCLKFLSSPYSGQSKLKQKVLGSLITIILIDWLCWYKRYSICLISFFSLYKFFPAFIFVNNVGSLINNLLEVKTFNCFPYFTSSSSPFSGGMSGISIKSSQSSHFSDYVSVQSLSSNFVCLLNVPLSSTVFSGSDLLFSSYYFLLINKFTTFNKKIIRFIFFTHLFFFLFVVLIHSLKEMLCSLLYSFLAFLYIIFFFVVVFNVQGVIFSSYLNCW